jgi:hypothetical protein
MNTENLHQIVYLSRATVAFTREELVAVSERSVTNNRSSEVGGALLYGHGMFLQALEGSREAVEVVLARIARDQRHTGIVRLVDHPISHRAFRTWAMTLIDLGSSATWTAEHQEIVERMAGVASVAPPGSGAHTLVGMFTKHVGRLAA